MQTRTDITPDTLPQLDAAKQEQIRSLQLRDEARPPRMDSIVLVGNSFFVDWPNIAADLAPFPVINNALAGFELRDIVNNADKLVLPYNPTDVIVFAGLEDLIDGRMPREVFHDYHRLADLVHVSSPKTVVSYLSLIVTPETWEIRDAIRVTNHLIAAYTKDHPQTNYIDIHSAAVEPSGKPRQEHFDDGRRPSRDGYAAWAPIITAALAG
jgi:hypothetical protein